MFLEGNITKKDYNKFQYINVIISPKTNNCIIKIWTSTCSRI